MRDLLAVGETMVSFAPVDGGAREASVFTADVAGGESNVAAHLARRGHRAAWVSRLGDDPFGGRILDELARRGVAVDLVEIDPVAPTGLMFKDPSPSGTRVRYARQGSAASRMSTDLLDDRLLADARIVHTTGVTAALSASCAAMVERMLHAAPAAGAMASFDVNLRPALWEGRDAGAELLRYAAMAEICFVGLDEAHALWGTTDPLAVRERLPEPRLLVVKDGAIGATCFERGAAAVFSPAPTVEVVEPVGAGDAFAGGFLSGLLDGLDLLAALERGHETAREVLRTTGDLPPIQNG